MPQAKPHQQTSAGAPRRVRASLEQIISYLQERTQDDATVVATVLELMRQGRLRRLAPPAPRDVDKAA